MVFRLLVVPVALITACGGGSKPTTGATTPPAETASSAVSACGAVTYSCTLPDVGCIEGGDDFKQVMAGECTTGGGTPADAACPQAGTLGGCQSTSGLVPRQNWCGTLWMSVSDRLATVEDAQAQCAKLGTYIAVSAP